MKKLKLLIFTKAIDGGTGTYVLHLKKLKNIFPQNSFQINTVVLEKPSYRLTAKDSFIFFRHKNFYLERYQISIKNIKIFTEDIVWFKKIVEKTTPDVILGVDIYCNLIISLLKILFFRKTKIVLTTHINLYDNIEQRGDIILKSLLRKCVNFFYNRADSLVFVSKHLAENCIDRFQLNKNIVSTIYNGILLKKTVNFMHKNNIIITISRLVEQKDHLTLIKAFSLVKKKIPNTKFWILSDGNERKGLENYVTKLKIENCVKFFGWVKNIYPYLKKTSIFVLSSKREGFAIVLVEAMSQGLPIISTDTPFGPSEILDNGKCGILVPMGDEKAMAQAMYELLTDEKKYSYYAQKSLGRAKYFSLDKMLRAYKKLILGVLNK